MVCILYSVPQKPASIQAAKGAAQLVILFAAAYCIVLFIEYGFSVYPGVAAADV